MQPTHEPINQPTSVKGDCNCLIVITGQFYVGEGNDFQDFGGDCLIEVDS